MSAAVSSPKPPKQPKAPKASKAPRQGAMQAGYKDMEKQNAAGRGNAMDIRKHRQQIMKLKQMNAVIRNELATETRLAAVNNSSTAAARLAKLREQKELYESKISMEKQRIGDMETQISELSRQIVAKKTEIGGEARAVENHRAISKKISILENQLDKALQRHSRQQTSNATLRTQIDNLRKDRGMMEKLQVKQERELSLKKERMQNIIDVAEGAYSARQKAHDHIESLKTAADQEQQQFLVEWEQLGGMVEHDRSSANTFGALDVGKTDASDMADVENFLKTKIVRAHWAIALDKAKQEVAVKKVQKYEAAFGKIKEATGITEVTQLVASFIAAEETTYSFFNVVNDLSRECETVERELGLLLQERAEMQGAAQDEASASPRIRVLSALEAKLKKAEMKTEQFVQKQDLVAHTLSELLPGLDKIYSGLGCAELPEAAELERENPDGLNAFNVDQYLVQIETKAIEKLSQYARKRAEEMNIDNHTELLIARPFVDEKDGNDWSVVPPTITMEEEDLGATGSWHPHDDDDETRPLTTKELRDSLQKSVGNKRQQ